MEEINSSPSDSRKDNYCITTAINLDDFFSTIRNAGIKMQVSRSQWAEELCGYIQFLL